MERRIFLTAASVGSLVGGPLARLVRAQSAFSSAGTPDRLQSFSTSDIDVAGSKIFARRLL